MIAQKISVYKIYITFIFIYLYHW